MLSVSNATKIFFAGMIRVFAKKHQLEEVDLYLDKLVIKFPGNFAEEFPLNRWFSSSAFEVSKSNDEDTLWTFHFSDHKAFIDEFPQ